MNPNILEINLKERKLKAKTKSLNSARIVLFLG